MEKIDKLLRIFIAMFVIGILGLILGCVLSPDHEADVKRECQCNCGCVVEISD